MEDKDDGELFEVENLGFFIDRTLIFSDLKPFLDFNYFLKTFEVKFLKLKFKFFTRLEGDIS